MKLVSTFYDRLLRRPWLVVVAVIAVIGSAVVALPNLRLEASSDSLLLQGDPDLAYFRESSAKYAGGEFLILTWEPGAPLLSPDSLEPLTAMVDELRRLPGVSGVTTLLDVPLLEWCHNIRDSGVPSGLVKAAGPLLLLRMRFPRYDSRELHFL